MKTPVFCSDFLFKFVWPRKHFVSPNRISFADTVCSRSPHRLFYLSKNLNNCIRTSFLSFFWNSLILKNMCLWTSHCDTIDVFFSSFNSCYVSLLLLRRGLIRSMFKKKKTADCESGCFSIDGQRSMGVPRSFIFLTFVRAHHTSWAHRGTHIHAL